MAELMVFMSCVAYLALSVAAALTYYSDYGKAGGE